MSQATLCSAIALKHIVNFYYSGDDAPGTRTVEPHMVAYSTTNNLVLSAWFLGGASESEEGEGWREYLIESITKVTILGQKFSAPPGYNPTGGKKLHNVQCAL